MLMAKRPHLSILDYGPNERAQVRKHLEKRKLRDLCIAGYNNFTGDLEHGDIPHREIQVHYICRTGAPHARSRRKPGSHLHRLREPFRRLQRSMEPGA